MLYLGEPLNLSASFAEELYAAASEYGEYADCFVAGALQAFSTYAQEVEAARWVGIASSLVDVASLLNNKHWLGYRQLAALASFPWTHGPIITTDVKEKFEILFKIFSEKFKILPREKLAIAMNHKRFGFIQDEAPRVLLLSVELSTLRASTKEVREFNTIKAGRYTVRAYKFEGKDVVLGIFSGDKPMLGVYNDMGRCLLYSALFAKDSEVARYVLKSRYDSEFTVYLLSLKNIETERRDNVVFVKGLDVRLHDVVKDVAASLLYAVGVANMGHIATEVTIAKPESVSVVRLAPSLQSSLGVDKAVFISQRGTPSRADILGVYDDNTIILGEVKPLGYNKFAELHKEITGVLSALGVWKEALGDYVAFAVYVFSGAGSAAVGSTYAVGSTWITPVSVRDLAVPRVVSKYKYVHVVYDEVSGRVAVGIFDAEYKDLNNAEWLKDAHKAVEDVLRRLPAGGESMGLFGELLKGRLEGLVKTAAANYRGEVEVFIDMLSP